MTEKRRLPEQIASHIYQPASAVRPAHLAKRQANVNQEREMRASRAQRSAPAMERHTLQRVVTIPRADPSTAWNMFAQRQEQLRRVRAKPQKYTELVPRTYAKTGVRATNGRIKAVRPLPRYDTSAIPTRSGRRGTRRGWFWKLLSIFAIGIVLILAMRIVFANNAFRIEQVNVVGTHNQALIHTIQRLGMQGQNIFLIDVARLTNHVQDYPLVATATLSKQWPNQITITVVERTPVLLWQTQQGTYGVDSQGVVIAPLHETVGADSLGTVVDTSSRGKAAFLRPGFRFNQADIAFARTIFNSVPTLTGITMFKLRYDGTTDSSEEGSYVIQSSAGWLAYLGKAQNSNPLENRLIELQQMLALAQQQQLKLATIDVRYGLHPVYTLKS